MEIGNFEKKNWYSWSGHYILGGIRIPNSCLVQGDNSGFSLSMDPSNGTFQMKCTSKIFHSIFVLQKSTPT